MPARELGAERLPATLVLVTLGMGFAVIVSLVLGSIAALRRPGSLLDRLTVTTSLVGLSLPQFWLGLLIVLGSRSGWRAPKSGHGGIDHAILPALALGLPSVGRLTQIVRSTMIDELDRQHIVTARAKGILSGTCWAGTRYATCSCRSHAHRLRDDPDARRLRGRGETSSRGRASAA